MSIALMAADTGHLVLATLHTIDAPQTVNRILSFYPPHQHTEIRFLLASTLQAVVSQRLIPKSEGRGRVPAVEVLLNTATIQEYLMSPEKTLMIKSAIQEGAQQYGSIEVAQVDLTADLESTESWQSAPLDPGEYTFLGFFDVDANGADTRDPEFGDPVTLPFANEFEINLGEEIAYTATFDLVLF